MPYDDEPTPYENASEPSPELDRLAYVVTGAAIEVHQQLGPGLSEAAYQRATEVELSFRQVPFEAKKPIIVYDRGRRAARAKLDLFVAGLLVVELKAVESLGGVHSLQVRTCTRLVRQPLGPLVNFNVPVLEEGVRRVIHSF